MTDEPLSSEKKKLILEFWERSSEIDPPSLDKISREALGCPFDGRTMEGRELKKYVSSFGINASSEKASSNKIVLSVEQKAFIENNRNAMTSIEITRELFKNPKLINLSAECRAVDECVLSFGPYLVFGQETVPQREWLPPNTLERVIVRVNRFFKMGNTIEREKLTPNQKKEMATLMRYLHTYRFTSQINKYESEEDRTLFESTFVRYAYNKSDLTEEEIDQYIMLAKESVIERITTSLISKLRRMADDSLEGNGEDKARISIGLVELIGKTVKDYDDCCKRQNNLVNSLKQKRSDRIAASQSETSSILNVIELWKAEKSRKEWIEIAKKRKVIVKEEVDRLSNMSDVMCKVMGISEIEALNG